MEVAALSDGVLTEILKGDGETVESDEVIARIENGSTDSKPAEKPKKKHPNSNHYLLMKHPQQHPRPVLR